MHGSTPVSESRSFNLSVKKIKKQSFGDCRSINSQFIVCNLLSVKKQFMLWTTRNACWTPYCLAFFNSLSVCPLICSHNPGSRSANPAGGKKHLFVFHLKQHHICAVFHTSFNYFSFQNSCSLYYPPEVENWNEYSGLSCFLVYKVVISIHK